MNILVIGKFYIEGFALHIEETLNSMGHVVRRFEPGIKTGRIGGYFGKNLDQVRSGIYSAINNIPAIRHYQMRELWHIIKEVPLDVVIVCHDFLWPDEVAELKRRTGAQIAMWFPDHLANFGRSFFMNSPYDGLFFKDPYIKYALGDVLQSPVYFLPECFNPERHWLPDEQIGNDLKYKCDITTAGNQHSWRVAYFKHLTNYNVKLWGNHAPLWMSAGPVASMYQGRGVYNHEKVRAFRGASIVVNNLHFGEIWGLNARSFEAAGAGAFQMIDWRPCLNQLFEDGKELITFRSIADLKEKIDYWLPRKLERQAIAKAAMRRAHKEHTYQLRLNLLLNTLMGKEKGFPVPNMP